MTRAAAINMRRLQRAFELVATNGPKRAGAQEQSLGDGDHPRVPQRRILFGKRHVLAVHVAPCTAPSFRMKHERKEA